MTGSGSPCGAWKFLRRKCARGCVFAPYFCHEQGAAHFSAIHRVFGESNVSKILTHLPVSERSEATLTISYEAQARIQDPIYGCVSHIFTLQQQVVNLQAQLSSLKQQAITNKSLTNRGCISNASERLFGNITSSSSTSSSSYPPDVLTWVQSEFPNPMISQFGFNSTGDSSQFGVDHENGSIHNNNNFATHFERACGSQDVEVWPSMASLDPYGNNYYKWPNHDSNNDLHSVAFGYSQHS